MLGSHRRCIGFDDVWCKRCQCRRDPELGHTHVQVTVQQVWRLNRARSSSPHGERRPSKRCSMRSRGRVPPKSARRRSTKSRCDGAAIWQDPLCCTWHSPLGRHAGCRADSSSSGMGCGHYVSGGLLMQNLLVMKLKELEETGDGESATVGDVEVASMSQHTLITWYFDYQTER